MYQLERSLIYHVFNRSNARQMIFRESEDFRHFKQLLKEYAEYFEAEVYHWVIMENHYHRCLDPLFPTFWKNIFERQARYRS